MLKFKKGFKIEKKALKIQELCEQLKKMLKISSQRFSCNENLLAKANEQGN